MQNVLFLISIHLGFAGNTFQVQNPFYTSDNLKHNFNFTFLAILFA